MVNYMLKVTAELENLTNLQPQNGCDDPNFSYFFKLKCGQCGEITGKETCLTLSETVQSGKGTFHLVQKKRSPSILMVINDQPGSWSNDTLDKLKIVMTVDRLVCEFSEMIPSPGVNYLKHDFILQCKFCDREGTVTMIPGKGRPLTFEIAEYGKYTPLMLFDCRGFEPTDFSFLGLWSVQSLKGTTFVDIDLSGGEFAEYDEKGEYPIMISNLKATFEVTK